MLTSKVIAAAALAAALAAAAAPGHFDELRGCAGTEDAPESIASSACLASDWAEFFHHTGRAGLRDMDERLVIQAGGLPIKIGGALVGGIGVGGAPSGDADAACARAGLDAIGAE